MTPVVLVPLPTAAAPSEFFRNESRQGDSSAAAMKTSVISDADACAPGNGKVEIPISTHEEPSRVGHFASFD